MHRRRDAALRSGGGGWIRLHRAEGTYVDSEWSQTCSQRWPITADAILARHTVRFADTCARRKTEKKGVGIDRTDEASRRTKEDGLDRSYNMFSISRPIRVMSTAVSSVSLVYISGAPRHRGETPPTKTTSDYVVQLYWACDAAVRNGCWPQKRRYWNGGDLWRIVDTHAGVQWCPGRRQRWQPESGHGRAQIYCSGPITRKWQGKNVANSYQLLESTGQWPAANIRLPSSLDPHGPNRPSCFATKGEPSFCTDLNTSSPSARGWHVGGDMSGMVPLTCDVIRYARTLNTSGGHGGPEGTDTVDRDEAPHPTRTSVAPNRDNNVCSLLVCLRMGKVEDEQPLVAQSPPTGYPARGPHMDYPSYLASGIGACASATSLLVCPSLAEFGSCTTADHAHGVRRTIFSARIIGRSRHKPARWRHNHGTYASDYTALPGSVALPALLLDGDGSSLQPRLPVVFVLHSSVPIVGTCDPQSYGVAYTINSRSATSSACRGENSCRRTQAARHLAARGARGVKLDRGRTPDDGPSVLADTTCCNLYSTCVGRGGAEVLGCGPVNTYGIDTDANYDNDHDRDGNDRVVITRWDRGRKDVRPGLGPPLVPPRRPLHPHRHKRDTSRASPEETALYLDGDPTQKEGRRPSSQENDVQRSLYHSARHVCTGEGGKRYKAHEFSANATRPTHGDITTGGGDDGDDDDAATGWEGTMSDGTDAVNWGEGDSCAADGDDGGGDGWMNVISGDRGDGSHAPTTRPPPP